MRCLVARAGFAGDICLSISTLRGIKQKFPKTHLTYMCWRQYAELISLSPWVDEVTAPGLYMASTFDKLLDLRHEALMGKYPERYWGELHARQAAAKGLLDLDEIESFKPAIFIGPDDIAEKEKEDKKLSIINAWSQNGSGWRLWSIDKWAALVQHLHDRRYTVVQLGGKQDPHVPGVDIQLCGKTRLAQVVGVLAVADLCVAIDSFVAHVAHAAKFVRDIEKNTIEKIGGSTPTVVLCGPIPGSCVIPEDANAVAISTYPDCDGPCFQSFPKEDRRICEHENSCMTRLPVSKVLGGIIDVEGRYNCRD